MHTIDLRNGARYGEYKDAMQSARARIAAQHDVAPEDVIVTCGATGGIDAVFGTLANDATVAMMPCEYFDADAIAQGHGLRVVRPHGEANVVSEFLSFITQSRPDAVYISVPNNPRGTEYAENEMRMLFAALTPTQLCIVDQTLLADAPMSVGALRNAARGKRIAVIRSFSKSHGAVHDRVGYVIASPNDVALHPFTHAPSQASLRKVDRFLRDEKTPARLLRRIVTNNRIVTSWAAPRTDVTWFPSTSNFGVLHVHAVPCEEVVARLRERGILLKNSNDLACPGNFIRIPLDISRGVLGALLAALDGACS